MSEKLILGDCSEELKKLKDDSIDLTVTSPPYDNLRNYRKSLEWNFDIFKSIADELLRVTASGGVVVWVVGDATIKGSETGTSFKQALYFKEIGFNLHDTMIYQKSGVCPSKLRYYPSFEYMFIFSKGNLKTFNPICDRKNRWRERWGKTRKRRKPDGSFGKEYASNTAPEYGMRTNTWKYTQGGGYGSQDKISYNHPATFPENLAHDHIVSWSNEGDTVLDPFMGSGTTGKMSKILSRNFIGIEKVPDYFKISKERIMNVSKGLF